MSRGRKQNTFSPFPSSVDMFYDLNLGVDGVGEQSRREMVAMAMQLGYSGVASNHTFRGVMADSERCKIRPLQLPTILSASPGLAEAARSHRELLRVPSGLPFRQFTRITVVVDSPAQANALNSGNPVLKTYDVVAVHPTNQKSFNQACSQMEIDLISLDACQKLPFRMKMPVVKAAIERGIFFEISYGRTIFDLKARRELFSNAQMLQAAARGRNIIVTSGAQRALEIRGPNDAANMSTLFGLTLESAKAAVSRNCKAVLMHGVMRKATHRGAIHIGHTHVTENSADPGLFNVPMDWDPLSLGGASADFIPVDKTLEVASKEETPPRVADSVTKETKSTTWAADINAPITSFKFNSSIATFKTFGDASQSDMQQKEIVIRGEGDGNSKETTSQVRNLLIGSASGLVFTSKSREVSATTRTENVQHNPVSPAAGKQAIKDSTKKVQVSTEKAGQKKGKKRKRKR